MTKDYHKTRDLHMTRDDHKTRDNHKTQDVIMTDRTDAKHQCHSELEIKNFPVGASSQPAQFAQIILFTALH